jgi:serine/threonine protein kinase
MTRLSDAALDRLRRLPEWPDLPDARYQPVALVGQGGMGTVFLAQDRELGREVALKVLREGVVGPEGVHRLRREARILARLEHPGVVPVHDVGTLPDGRVYYVMKLVRGSRLDEHARSIPLPDLLRLFLRICDTVGFAHAHGVIHRDLKPSNLMVGAFGEVLVMDWGVAGLIGGAGEAGEADEADEADKEGKAGETDHVGPGSATGDSWETRDGTIVGTPGFMAPEQARGEVQLVDARSDVYALGAVLKLLVTGVDRGVNAAPVSFRPLEAIWRKAMAPLPEGRYSSAQALGRDVARLLDQQPIEAYREPPLERVRRVVTKYQTPIALVLAYLAMRILFIVSRGL